MKMNINIELEENIQKYNFTKTLKNKLNTERNLLKYIYNNNLIILLIVYWILVILNSI